MFGGFAAPELAVRIADSQPKLVITSTCGLEGAKVLPYMPLVDRYVGKRFEHPGTLSLAKTSPISFR